MPGSAVALLLIVLSAIAASAQPIPKAVPMSPYPLDLKLSVKREGDKALGTATITNPTKETVQVPLLTFDIRFTDAETGANKDDIRQQFNLPSCGSTKLPAALPPGAKLECPFASRDNIYNGPISIVAAVNDPADSEGTSYHIAFDVADVNPNSSANNAMQSGNGTTGEASAQPIPKAVPMPPYPLDLKLSVKREGDKAVGTATITNPTKGTVQVPMLAFDIRFTDAESGGDKDDMQQFRLPSCGSTKLPAALAPGAKLECPFTSRDNIYKGSIRIVAAVNDPADSEGTSNHIAFDLANVDPNSAPSPAAASNAMQSGNGTAAVGPTANNSTAANNGTAAANNGTAA